MRLTKYQATFSWYALCSQHLVLLFQVNWNPVPYQLEHCSMWLGTVFHLSWNRTGIVKAHL